MWSHIYKKQEEHLHNLGNIIKGFDCVCGPVVNKRFESVYHQDLNLTFEEKLAENARLVKLVEITERRLNEWLKTQGW